MFVGKMKRQRPKKKKPATCHFIDSAQTLRRQPLPPCFERLQGAVLFAACVHHSSHWRFSLAVHRTRDPRSALSSCLWLECSIPLRFVFHRRCLQDVFARPHGRNHNSPGKLPRSPKLLGEEPSAASARTNVPAIATLCTASAFRGPAASQTPSCCQKSLHAARLILINTRPAAINAPQLQYWHRPCR